MVIQGIRGSSTPSVLSFILLRSISSLGVISLKILLSLLSSWRFLIWWRIWRLVIGNLARVFLDWRFFELCLGFWLLLVLNSDNVTIYSSFFLCAKFFFLSVLVLSSVSYFLLRSSQSQHHKHLLASLVFLVSISDMSEWRIYSDFLDSTCHSREARPCFSRHSSQASLRVRGGILYSDSETSCLSGMMNTLWPNIPVSTY